MCCSTIHDHPPVGMIWHYQYHHLCTYSLKLYTQTLFSFCYLNCPVQLLRSLHHNMVTEVDNFNTQSVLERETLNLAYVESAQLHVREHLYAQIDKIYGDKTEWKSMSLILSRDAQLHVHALSVPSLTVRKRNVIFPVNFPSQNSQQSTPPPIWIESLLWNLINTMELDAPCRGLKLRDFRAMISDVADAFHRFIIKGEQKFQECRHKKD